MARSNTTTLLAEIAAMRAEIAALRTSTSAPVAPIVAAHVGPSGKPDGRTRACNAAVPCDRLFRSDSGRAWHVANVHGGK